MKVQVIVGSIREGRISDKAAKWVANEANQLEGIEAEVVDLRDYELAFFDEALPPQYNPNRKPAPATKKWLDKLAEADAYVIVTPEYNRSMPGALKNALEYIDFQFQRKAVMLVAHGSTGGAQAVASLRITLAGNLAAVLPKGVFFSDGVAKHIDDEGNLSEEVKANPYGPETALKDALADLKWYGDALVAAR